MATSFHDKLERRSTWGFLFGLVGLGLIWFLFASYPKSARIAAIGGTLAFYGVALMSIGVFRVGLFRYMENLATGDIRNMFGMPDPELTEDERDQRLFEMVCQNVFGPYLVGIGTLVNGFSGML